MSDLITANMPLLLDFMVVAILACGVAIRLHKGLYNSLMPLAVIAASAVCGLTLSSVLSGPISDSAIPGLTEYFHESVDQGLYSIDDLDRRLSRLEQGATDELRQAVDLSRYTHAAHDMAHDAGDALATVNDEVLTDENIDTAVSSVENAAGQLTEKVPEVLLDPAREALEEKGLTGDAAREYIRQAGDALGSAGETVLTDENIDAAIAAVQQEMNAGTQYLYGAGEEGKQGREAFASAEDEKTAAKAAVSALVAFLTPRYVRVVTFLIGWVAFLAVLTIVKNTFGLAFKLPVVKQVDKLGGAALGFVEAAAEIWLVLWIVSYLGFNVFRELGQRTAVLRFFT